MKRILFLFIVFVFTTGGFFKSALEECADTSQTIKIYGHGSDAEYKQIPLTESEIEANKKKYQKKIDDIKSKCPSSGCKISDDIRIIRFKKERDFTHKYIVTRDIPLSERKAKYKKFIKQSLKNKMKVQVYETQYEYCIAAKKRNPELFKAKYD